MLFPQAWLWPTKKDVVRDPLIPGLIGTLCQWVRMSTAPTDYDHLNNLLKNLKIRTKYSHGVKLNPSLLYRIETLSHMHYLAANMGQKYTLNM